MECDHTYRHTFDKCNRVGMFASKPILETLHFISLQCAAVGALVQYAAGDTEHYE